MKRQYNQLPQVGFSILLALSLKERHGYEIIKQIEEDSQGKIKLSPGALYASIKQLYEQNLISEVENKKDTRRRFYKLTDTGRQKLSSELEYYENTIRLGKKRKMLTTDTEYA